MKKTIEQIHQEALNELEAASEAEAVQALSVRYLGRKGVITSFLRNISKLEPEKRPEAGKKANETKKALDKLFKDALKRLERTAADTSDYIDVSLPGRKLLAGSLHPITQITRLICDIFTNLGFDIVEGPEVETDHYNFEALNIPKDHPARDDQDSFYITKDILLRPQTSPVQIRTMENQKPPVRIIATGKCYRRDATDSTHSPMFHQIEGLAVDKDITFSDLKGILTVFVHRMFGKDRKVRFRPGYFPFVEPGAEVDVSCLLCGGKGCKSCGYVGWLEIMGAGAVHPKVLEMVGYDPEEYSGFAFGMGAERIAMLKYGINDIRLFFENDLRFLKQF